MSAVVGDLRSALAEVMELQAQGRHAQARARCELILYQRPGLPAALLLLARSLRALGELPAAQRVLAAAEGPLARLPEYRAERGRLALVTGQPAVAIRELEIAALTRPDDPEIWRDLTQAILESGDPRAAARMRMSLNHLEAPPEAWGALINLFTAFGDEAAANNLAASAPEPDDPAVLFARANLAVSTGAYPRAEELFRRMISGGLAVAEAFAGLIKLRRFEDRDDPMIREMEALLEEGDGDGIQKERVAFSLAKALDDVGDHDAAWHHLDTANESKRSRSTAYRPQQDRRLVHALASVFPDADAVPSTEVPEGPVLVVGLPRAGTNLVAQMLSNHPSLHAAGEQLFLSRRFLMPPRSEAALRERLRSSWLEPARKAYASVLGMGEGRERVLDRYPANFFSLGYFAHLFPGGRIVHCRRDLTETAISMYMQDFPMGNLYANAPEDIAQFAVLYQELMGHWRQVLGERLIEVDYEDVVDDPGACLPRVMEALGLDWDPACGQLGEDLRHASGSRARAVPRAEERASVYPEFTERFHLALSRARETLS